MSHRDDLRCCFVEDFNKKKKTFFNFINKLQIE